MFYSIDLNGLRVLHKHERVEVVGMLAHMEACDCDVLITSIGTPGSLDGFTIFELHKLFANMSGKKFEGFDEAKLRAAIYASMDSLPATDCLPYEVERQCGSIALKDTKAYRYVKGAIRPALRTEGLAALMSDSPTGDFQFKGDPPIVSESSEPAERRIPVKRESSSGVIARPTDGIGAEIWAALDADASLNDGLAIQAEARKRGWNTLTAILQLAQWKKFKQQGEGS